VGEIFERGLGGTPDYPAAAIWYQKVVDNPKLEDKARARALFDLGTLYEQGLGVEKNQLTALNLYRRAWGAPADDLVYKSAADQKVEDLRAALSQEIADRDKELQVMQKHCRSRNSKKMAASRLCNGWSLSCKPPKQRVRKRSRNCRRRPRRPQAPPCAPPPRRPKRRRSIAARWTGRLAAFIFGRYYALIIGNQNYDQMESLKTPLYDAVRAAQILKDKYGFTVQIIEDGTGVAMLKALNELNAVLTENDNFTHLLCGSRVSAQDGDHGGRLLAAPQRRSSAERHILGTQ